MHHHSTIAGTLGMHVNFMDSLRPFLMSDSQNMRKKFTEAFQSVLGKQGFGISEGYSTMWIVMALPSDGGGPYRCCYRVDPSKHCRQHSFAAAQRLALCSCPLSVPTVPFLSSAPFSPSFETLHPPEKAQLVLFRKGNVASIVRFNPAAP